MLGGVHHGVRQNTNISSIDAEAAEHIKSLTDEKNFVLVINGMRDFNLHSEILKAAQKSLKLYGLPDDGLKKLNYNGIVI